jgi:hypothetical protein
MNFTWQGVIAALGGQAIFLGAAVWLIRKLVSHGMDRDLAKFKAELKAGADCDIEKLRNELRFDIERHKNSLRMAELEHRIRFSRLHEKRAHAIAKLYSLMIEADWIAQGFIYGDIASPDKAAEAKDKALELSRYFESHRLYLPDSVCIILGKFVNKLFTTVNAMKIYWTEIEHPTPQTVEQRNERMQAAFYAFQNELPAIKILLETEFRSLLGAVDEEWLVPTGSVKPST